MPPEKDKLLIRIGQNFEANATGTLAILIAFATICLMLFIAGR